MARPYGDVAYKVLGVDDALSLLRWHFDEIAKAESGREEVYRRPGMPQAAADEIAERIERQIKENYDEIKNTIERAFVLCAEHHQRHFRKFEEFYENVDPGKSVFIMTKFPDADEADDQLQTIISCVEECVRECGFVPRIARGRAYHDHLWDNVELHLLACSRGIAILEDKSRGELNPNVAMEWGFMRALGKPVLYLEEEEFGHNRADWEGLLRSNFSWDKPKPDIEKAVKQWLKR